MEKENMSKRMRTKIYFPFLSVLLASMIGCSNFSQLQTATSTPTITPTPYPTPTPTPINLSFEDICSYSGTRVSVHGKFFLPSQTWCQGPQCQIELVDLSYESTNLSVKLLIHIGSGSNQMEPLPNSYSMDDLKVHTDDGRVVGVEDEVLVSGLVGKIYSPCAIWAQIITVP
jgi:hypothetical protein